ncbi:MAG: Bacterial regulatory protein, tetR family [Candidatus Izimaplasma bacterium HR2]|nr:MAG: Bacterial regulatory protein, tetR family [Candidatus Izimaplasma bacterium HR2]
MTIKEKNIKQQRVEGYFIDAAKVIIKKEGPQAVTVRKIAEISGYSYGSIYNYYKDLEELMFHVKNSMIQDMINTMHQSGKKPQTIEDIQVINREFANFFMDNPNIYEFYYNYPIKTKGKTPIDDIGFNETRLQVYQVFVDMGILAKEDLEAVFWTILCSLYGLLNLYFSSNGLTKEDVYSGLDRIIEFTLRRR